MSSTIRLTDVHDALLQQLAEQKAAREGIPLQRARRYVELHALTAGLVAVQEFERGIENAELSEES